MSRVDFVQVEKMFTENVGVKNINLTIQEGEFFTLLGPSGCGKTTTLRMIAGFYFPTAGKIEFDGRDVTNVPPHLRNTGMVFQNYALFPHMTVFENIAFGLKVRKLPKAEIKQKVERALEQVRLPGYGSRRMTQLSGGQQQRIALARALVIQPRILLLDEPLSNLDARLRDEMRTEILTLQRELGITTVYVTHDQEEALSMSNRIAVFQEGYLQQIGTPQEIYHTPSNGFVASFVGESNLIPIQEIEKSDDSSTVTALGQRISLPEISTKYWEGKNSGDWRLSIRPESVKISAEAGPNSIPGKIRLIQFTGSVVQVTVDLEHDNQNIAATVLLMNQAHVVSQLREGEKVWLHLPEEHLRILPASWGASE
ncbi:ABC transporter ATP-binding protein [Risungbinella massiliensis]|uniref:ABC transporter ATP-binding protein n=1 Tax=Risungbinella massiliensis TaxID=1329796 RepID=UPI001E330E5C|nr:ABC transporter ATP-binding protein [Risungbinella massiliensis]